MIEKYCKGCGVRLQNEDEKAEGYVVREEMDYCQRCFRMRHYNSQTELNESVTEDKLFEMLAEEKGHYVWIIDCLDFESAIHSRFTEFFRNRRFSIIINKLDIFDDNISADRITEYIVNRLRNYKLTADNIILRGDRSFRDTFNAVFADSKKNLILCGLANSGKSTIINDILQTDVLTVNRNPSTTLRFNRIKYGEINLIDTVGLRLDSNIVSHLSDSQLRTVVPVNVIRPSVYQLKGDQTLIIGGLVRIDVFNSDENFSAITYVSNLLDIHRGSQKMAEKNFSNPQFQPKLSDSRKEKCVEVIDKNYKRDICISGLGFVTVNGNFDKINVYCDDRIDIYIRKAMI